MVKISWEFWGGKDFSSRLMEVIDQTKPLMFDTETIGLYGKIRLAQFYQEGFEKPILINQPDITELVSVLDKCWVVCHNASYDISTVQENLGRVAWCPERLDDTFYLSRLHYYDKDKFSFDTCLSYALGYNPYKGLDSTKKVMQKSGWDSNVLSDEQKSYASFDVYYMLGLWQVVAGKLDSTSYKLDMITLKSNLRFQRNGMPVDRVRLNTMFAKNKAEVDTIDLPVNCNSYKQVRPYIDSDNSDDAGLALLSAQGNERAIKVRRVRKLLKENSFLTKFSTTDGHIYGKFSPSARSGRSTCRDQNLQQLPRSTKGCFGVEENGSKVMLYSDFSQLELRCVCSITGDIAMEKLYRDGIDIHTYVAERLFGSGEVTKEHRRIAKTCNFSLLYGSGVDMFLSILLKSTGIILPYKEAESICRRWRNLWAEVKSWQQRGLEDWRKKLAWCTPLGRHYVAKRMNDQLNIQVQGMGSEVAKLANHYMEESMRANAEGDDNPEAWKDWACWQRNFIHDSYIFIVPNEPVLYEQVARIIAKGMEEAWIEMSAACKITSLPMPVKVDVGYNWGDIENGDVIATYTNGRG